MKRFAYLLLALPLFTGCYKDELDVTALNNNPFDPGYEGPNVFHFDSTYVETVQAPTPYNRQVFRFHVDEALFLTPQDGYQVQVRDLGSGVTQILGLSQPTANSFTYFKIDYAPGELCLEVALNNGLYSARKETICGILQ
jgi:hypothetical protein